MSEISVQVEVTGKVATLTVARPPLNILDLETLAALGEAAESLAGRQDVALVQVRGAGPKAFCAGVSVADHTPDKVGEMIARFHFALQALSALPMPTLAVVHGFCLGGGMELAAACDFVLASDNARFGQPEIELGCWPPYAAALYPRRLGEARTLELVLTGRTLSAAEAERWGFVQWLAPQQELETRVAELSALLTSKSAAVARLAKRGVAAGVSLPFTEALRENERLYLDELCATEDMHEGLAAFLEKRKPVWKDR